MHKKPKIYRPKNPAAVCKICRELAPHLDNGKTCLREGRPELVLPDIREHNYKRPTEKNEECFWMYCTNYRCLRGREFAKERLEKARKKESFKTLKTLDGNLVKGVDASLIKKGFVDEKGRFYTYHKHDIASGLVIPTGQKLSKKELERK